MCLALGVEKLDDAAAKLGDILDMQPPRGASREGAGPPQAEVGRGLTARRPSPRRRARRSSTKATTSTSGGSRSSAAGRATRRRSSRCPAVITKDPKTGARNVGMYRMQVIDRASTFMHWQMHKDGRADLLASEDGRIPVAVAIGLDPVTAYSASAPAPAPPRRAHARRLPARRAGRARPLQDRRPRGARERGDRPRRARLEGRRGHRGPVRRPHGLLLARRGVPDLPASRR